MAVKTLTAEERETTITLSDDVKRATIYTEQRIMITKIRNLAKRHPDSVRIYREGKHGSTSFVEADLPAAFVGLRPAKHGADATNGNPSPMRSGAESAEEWASC